MTAKLPLHLEVLSKSDLEGMCVNCGLCCYAGVPVAKGVNALLVQKGSDGETCCSVYDERFEKAKGWCLPLAEAIQKGIFPEICPYVQDLKGYAGKVLLDHHTYDLVMPQIRKALTSEGQPRWLSDRDWKSFSEEK